MIKGIKSCSSIDTSNERSKMFTINLTSFRIAIMASILLTFFVIIAQGETHTKITDNGVPPSIALSPTSGNPKIGDYGAIGTFNGRLNYTIPLLNVGGRGEAFYSIPLNINRLWIFDYTVFYALDENGNDTVPIGQQAFPWLLDNTLPKYMPGKLAYNVNFPSLPCSVEGPMVYQGKLSFASTDGSDISLFPKIYPNGAMTVPCISHNSQHGGQYTPISLGNVFISPDGSGVKFVSDVEAFVGAVIPTTGYLFKSGSRYRIEDGFVLWIEDRNGNRTTFSYEIHPNTGTRTNLTQITDPNGRVTNISYNLQSADYGLHDEIKYPGFNGAEQKIRITYGQLGTALRTGDTLKTIGQLFPGYSTHDCYVDPSHNNNCTVLFDPPVVKSITFPGNRKFIYKYDSYAELARVETPNGVAFEYDWGGSLESGSNTGVIEYSGSSLPDLFRQVTEKRVYPTGGSGSSFELRTTIGKVNAWDVYTPNTNQFSTRTVSYFDYNNVRIGMEKVKYQGHPLRPSPKPFDSSPPDLFPDLWSGKDLESSYYGADGVTALRRDLKEWAFAFLSNGVSGTVQTDPRVTKEISIATEGSNAIVTLQETEFDVNGASDLDYFARLNPKRSKSYNYKPLAAGSVETATFQTLQQLFNSSDLIAVSENDYSYDPTYKARGIASRPVETRVLNPANATGPPLAKSQMVYDEQGQYYSMVDYGTTTNWVNPNSTLRGNVTTSRTWYAEENRWIETHTQSDDFGNIRKVWDTSGDATRFVEVEYSPTYHYAYPTKTKAPAPDPSGVHGMTEGSEISRVYDFNTGLLTSVTDANGQTATTEYDALLRPIRINPPAGGSVSETVYNDTPGNIWVKSRQQTDEYNWAESTTYFDNLGRPLKSRTKNLQGDVVSEIKYDSFGRVKATSNPYRVDANGNATEPVYWSKPRYDELNRVVETYAPALVDPNSSAHGPSMGTVQFGISTEPNLIGAYTVATDASGRKSRAVSGIYGLMRVDEATGIGGTVDQDLGTLANPHQPTSYSYNVKGELVKITQGKSGQPTQYRYFAYDGLGRLTRVRQPEQTPNTALATTGNPDNNSWTAGFSYDVFGNVISMTDAKNTTITNEYDKASRPVKRTYTDGTPQVEFFYDGKGLPAVPQFSRGSLTKATSSVSEDRFTSFDNHSRLLVSQQITDGNTYDFEYKYNLSGGLTETKYPSGRITRNFLDTDGGLNLVTTKAANGFTKQVASNFDYSAVGAVKKMKLGNGLWETTQLNERHQLTQVGLGTTQTNNNLFKIDYEYGELSADATTVDTAKNIGMIARTTTTIPTTSFAQTFKYDAINRLTEAKETAGTNTTANWIQTFGYDRFGNRTNFSQTVNGNVIPNTNINHPTIDATNNRFTTGQGYVYDFNGNLINDAEGRSFTFNGDDKQTEVRNISNQIVGQYFYDGSGARVKKIVPSTGETTVFVYDAGGALAAEYSTVAPQPNPTTSYLTTDHLGSPRVITDKTGNVIARRDFMPFGEELRAGIGGRSESLKYSTIGSDNIRKRFTGYDKDDETGLDFAEARMYQNKHGRFTAPDPLLASASALNPQTYNRYTYTGNNPINYTDPDGLCFDRATGKDDGKPCANFSGQVYVNKNGVLSMAGGKGFRPLADGENYSVDAYGVTYTVTGGANGGWTMAGQQPASQNANGGSPTGSANGTVTDPDLAGGSSPSGQRTPEGALPLPCPSDGSCGHEPLYTSPLDTGATEEDLDRAQLVLDGIAATEIPVVSQGAGALSAIADFGRGRPVDGLLGLGGLTPLFGNALDAVKAARRVNKVVDTVGDVARTTPSLPAKTIAKQDGVTIHHNYKSNDHLPPHAHVKGGGPETKIGANGNPIKGSPELTSKQQSVVAKNKSVVRRDINKIRKWLRYNKWGK